MKHPSAPSFNSVSGISDKQIKRKRKPLGNRVERHWYPLCCLRAPLEPLPSHKNLEPSLPVSWRRRRLKAGPGGGDGGSRRRRWRLRRVQVAADPGGGGSGGSSGRRSYGSRRRRRWLSGSGGEGGGSADPGARRPGERGRGRAAQLAPPRSSRPSLGLLAVAWGSRWPRGRGVARWPGEHQHGHGASTPAELATRPGALGGRSHGFVQSRRKP